MRIFIKYKHKRSAYAKGQGFYDTASMYYFNGSSYKILHDWYRIIHCIQQNYPIIVLDDDVDHPIDNEDFASKISFVINPSCIEKVFPVRQGDEVTEKKETKFDKRKKAAEFLDQYLDEEKIEVPEYNVAWMDDPKSICHNCGFTLDSENACGGVLHDKFRTVGYIGSTNKDGLTS